MGLAALLVTAGTLVSVGTPAAAAQTRTVRPTSVTFTDSARPGTAFPVTDGSAPVGAWQDEDGRHVSRVYLTYDLTPLHGKQVLQALGMTGETSVDDCARPRSLELWRTDPPATAPTWQNAPTVREKVADLAPDAPCPAAYLEVLLTSAVRQAVDAGWDSVTYLVRVSGDMEQNKHHGRRIKPLLLSVAANSIPDVPTELTVNGLPCAGNMVVGTATPTLSVQVTDPDRDEFSAGDQVFATFAWWPVDRPAERTEHTTYAVYTPGRLQYAVPSGLMTHGGRYAFQVRAADVHASSEWSPECRFSVDTVRPPTPTVSSTDYPSDRNSPGHGGPGIAGTFVFGPNGGDDVVGYWWGTSSLLSYAAADGSGAATVTHTPTRSGPAWLNVQAVDRAGNRSPQLRYEFHVRSTAPTVTDQNPDAWLGRPRTVTFSANMADVVEYTYRLDDGAAQVVAAGTDGSATVTVTPTVVPSTLYVTSRTRDGLLSGEAAHRFTIRTEPFVSSAQWPFDGTSGAPVGTEGSFVFRPAMEDVAEYVYSINDGVPQTVPAGADGTATVPYTPVDAGYHTIRVFSRTGSGVVSATIGLAFYPASVAPTVSSAVYPSLVTGGGPGVTGSFTFRPHAQVTGVVSYVYSFGREVERTVTAGADGTATVAWTPQAYDTEAGGWVQLRVRARTGTGTVTDAAYYAFRVDPLNPTVTSEVFTWSGGAVVGQTGDFVFTAGQPGATEFVYVFDDGSEQTVPVGTDGTATVSWTAGTAYSHSLTVRTRTAGGLLSGPTYYNFWIDG